MAFSRFLKSALIVNCMLMLFLTSGFVLPGEPLRDPKAVSQPEAYYDGTAKTSPFAPPAPAPVCRKVEIPLITARGEHPTFVPPETPDASVSHTSFDNSRDWLTPLTRNQIERP